MPRLISLDAGQGVSSICLQAVDSVVAQHAVAKVTGTVDGVMLVTGVLAPQEHPALALANCALHLLRISRQVRSADV